MARKPAHMTMVGGKSPRQRIWEAVRANPARFTCDTIARELVKVGRVDEQIIMPYLRALEKAGFIECTEPSAPLPKPTPKAWKLARDNGVEAPRLDKYGKPVTMGLGNESMWGTLRRMCKTRPTNFRQLAAFASTADSTVLPATARTYLQMLAHAGYLECIQPGKNGKSAAPASFLLRPHMDTGPRPPMIQRTKSVYDPNLGQIVWQEEPDHDC